MRFSRLSLLLFFIPALLDLGCAGGPHSEAVGPVEIRREMRRHKADYVRVMAMLARSRAESETRIRELMDDLLEIGVRVRLKQMAVKEADSLIADKQQRLWTAQKKVERIEKTMADKEVEFETTFRRLEAKIEKLKNNR